MGFSGISIPSLVIILVIVLLLFGTKKLRNLGGDLGGAIKGFKKAVTDDEKDKTPESVENQQVNDNEEADSMKKTDKHDAESK